MGIPLEVAFAPNGTQLEIARQALEQVYKLPAVTPPTSAALGARAVNVIGDIARWGIAALAGRYSTSEGELNFAKDTGQIGRNVTMDDMRNASLAMDRVGMKGEGLGQDWSADQRTRFIMGAAALNRLHHEGRIDDKTLHQVMNELSDKVQSVPPTVPTVPPIHPFKSDLWNREFDFHVVGRKVVVSDKQGNRMELVRERPSEQPITADEAKDLFVAAVVKGLVPWIRLPVAPLTLGPSVQVRIMGEGKGPYAVITQEGKAFIVVGSASREQANADVRSLYEQGKLTPHGLPPPERGEAVRAVRELTPEEKRKWDEHIKDGKNPGHKKLIDDFQKPEMPQLLPGVLDEVKRRLMNGEDAGQIRHELEAYVARLSVPRGTDVSTPKVSTSEQKSQPGQGEPPPPPSADKSGGAPAGGANEPGVPPAGVSSNLATLTRDPTIAENAATLEAIRNAPPAEINRWLEGLSVKQREELPLAVQDAILANVLGRIDAASKIVNPTVPAHPLANDPSLQRYGREILKDLTLQMEANKVSQRVSQHGPFTAVLFDSGNGGLAAARVAAQLLSKWTGGRVQLVTMGDHQNQPYGNKNEQQITGLVFNAIQAGASLDPAVIAMACNTACIALFRANETGTSVPSNGVPVLNLIDNTSRVVSDPANRTAFGERPLILSTQATANSNLYQTLIPQYSNEEVTPYSVGGSDAPVTTPDNRTEIRDLATLVNQLAHRDPAREEEVMNAARHYVARMPEDMTSLVMCCTHYPELIPFFRKALNERGMQHVPIFDPMPDQILSIVRTLDQSVVGVEPPAVQSPTGPNAVITSAAGRDNTGAQPGSGLQTFENVFPSVPALTGEDAAVFSGQDFGSEYDPTIVRSFLDGELSAVDAATVGFHGRNLHTFFNPGGARDAATALNGAENVMLLTGFNVPPNPNDPTSIPRPETDGPPGTAALANGLLNLGKQVTIVTDSANRPVVEASLRALGADLSNPNLNIVEFNAKGAEAVNQARDLIDRYNPDIVGAIELPGRNEAGQRTNMGGIVIDGYNADLDTILIEANARDVRTVGVGDGGNEAGMGHLDLSRVALRTPSVVGADIAVTAENSNLGAYAVLAELVRINDRFDQLLTPEQLRSSVRAAVEAGAVDGVSRRPENTVDGFSLPYHERLIERLNGAVQGTWPPAQR